MMLLSPSQTETTGSKGYSNGKEIALSHIVGAAIALSEVAGLEIRKVKKEGK